MKTIDFAITETEIVDLTDETHSIYNQIKRGDIEGVKIGAGTHKCLADVPFRITSKTTGESHVVVTDDNGSSPLLLTGLLISTIPTQERPARTACGLELLNENDSKSALPHDTYIIEELRSDGNKGFELIPPFEIVVSRNNLVIDLGTLTDEYETTHPYHSDAARTAKRQSLQEKRLRLLIPSN